MLFFPCWFAGHLCVGGNLTLQECTVDYFCWIRKIRGKVFRHIRKMWSSYVQIKANYGTCH